MISQETYKRAQAAAFELFAKAGIVMTDEEKNNLEVADFGLNDLWNTGLEIVTYVNTDRVCAKELALTPGQTCPEHRHPPLGTDYPGKEETFRCRYGTVYLYVAGEPTPNRAVQPPVGEYTAFHEVILTPGKQYTLMPDTLHWFRAGSEGAVVSEFSTKSVDGADVFSDKRLSRAPEVAE